MDLKKPVSSLMTTDIITLGPDEKLMKVKDIFTENHIHHIPVLENGQLIGMISKTDYLYFIRPLSVESNEPYLNEIRLKNYTVREAMTKFIITVSPNDTLHFAIDILNDNLFHALPVVEDGDLVGIITTHDILFRLLHPTQLIPST